MSKPKVYLASKLYRANEWRLFRAMYLGVITVVSTWHDSDTVEQDDANSDEACRLGWIANRDQVIYQADVLIAIGTKTDPLNGTMIEIGMAYGRGIPIYLVGDYPWGTWKILPNVYHVDNVVSAVDHLLKG